MTHVDRASTLIDGRWEIVLRPEQAPPYPAALVLTTTDDGLSVRVDGADGSSTTVIGALNGQRLSWTTTLGPAPIPWEFRAEVDGDTLHGSANATFGTFRTGASLAGIRAGSDAHRGFREGSEALVETLTACGIEYVFGCAGGMTVAVQRDIVAQGVGNMNARTELSAAWMAYGYNRIKRRAAAAVLTWCVGSLHAAPVVLAAKLDSTPLLFMSMGNETAWDVRDALQNSTDLYSAFRPLSKYVKRIVNGEDLPVAVRQAVLAASTGKFGPAVLDLTPEAMFQKATVKTEALTLPSPPAATDADVRRTLDLIRSAANPVLLVGAGVHMSDATAEVRQFVDATGIPVVSSGPGGRGVLPDDHPLYAGDMSGWGYFGTGTQLAEESDLWIAIGFSFSQTATLSWSLSKPETVIHVDVEQSQIGRIFQPTVGIVADAKVFLKQLNNDVDDAGLRRADGAPPRTLRQIAEAKERYLEQLRSFVNVDPILPAAVGQVLSDEVPPGTILVNDEGFTVPGMVYRQDKYPSGHTPAMGFHYSSMGSTLPVAIGAKLAAPDQLVVSIGGDGGFFYDCSDLAVLAERNLKVVCIVLNNGGLYGGRRAREHSGAQKMPIEHWSDIPDNDYVGIARSMGVPGEKVEKAEELVTAVRRAVQADGPYFIEVVTSASTLHLLMGGWPDPNPTAVRKFGHGDREVRGSWP